MSLKMRSNPASLDYYETILRSRDPRLAKADIAHSHGACLHLHEMYLKQSTLKQEFTSISLARNELIELEQMLEKIQRHCNSLSLNAKTLLWDSGFRAKVFLNPTIIVVANAKNLALNEPDKPNDENLIFLITKLILHFQTLFSANPRKVTKEFVSEVMQCLGPAAENKLNDRLNTITKLSVSPDENQYQPILHKFKVGADISRQYAAALNCIAWHEDLNSINENEAE